MDCYADVAAVLLAGGSSGRMGKDKALLAINAVPVVQWLALRLREITDEVMISTNNPSAYEFLGLPIIPDRFPGHGPMAGIHAAMHQTRRPWMLVLACDLPGVSAQFLRNMVERKSGFEAVIPINSDGELQPVCALYHRSCLPAMERNLAANDNGLIFLLREPGLRIHQLRLKEELFSNSELLDIDTPEDFAKFLRISKA
jgi:molybdopterin-guanine dinucleotide biosynthesis protein A